MGRKGPAPTPKNILRLRGSPRAKYGRRGEPEAAAESMSVPTWLDAEGKRCWRYVLPLLMELDVIGSIDRAALSRYCFVWSCWRRAATAVAASEAGAEARMLKLAAELNRAEDRFGMTPAARANVRKLDSPKGDAKKARFFKGA